MSHETDKWWKQVARGLARHAGCAPMTPDEAQKEFESLPDVKLPDQQIESIIERVTSGEMTDWTPLTPKFDLSEFDCQAIQEDVWQLNRNEGDADAETDELINRLRRQALEDGQDDGQDEPDGMDGDPKSPGQGG